MLTIIVLSVILALAAVTIGVLGFRLSKSRHQCLELQTRYQTNPSYDCQQMMADLMAGNGLFRIERIERENLLLYRR